MGKKLVRFDWAMKKMLRQKANFDILEGFLSELLEENVEIKQVFDSETSKEREKEIENAKLNRIDVLIENQKGELIIIELQSTQDHSYFHQMLYGASIAIAERIKEDQPHISVKKVISITIAYIDLGQSKDYVYHGTTVFKGRRHKEDILGLSDTQMKVYDKVNVHEIYPEYWVIKTAKFRNRLQDKLDEWVYFFKNGEIKDTFTAKGLKEANDRLDETKLSEKDRKSYNTYLNNWHIIAGRNQIIEIDAKDIIEKTKKETQIESVIGFHEIGVSKENIANALKMSIEKVAKIIQNHKK